MALTEQVVLDIQSAERQISTLESQLAQLSAPINVPIDIGDIDESQFERIAQALGISQDEARALAGQLQQGITETSKLDADLREVARSLGLSEREASQFVRQMRQAEVAAEETADATLRIGTRGASAFTSLRGSLLQIVGVLGLIQAARFTFDFATDAIQSASDLEQSIGAVDAVFGELGNEVRAFGETADQSVGLAASQFNQLASLLGSQLQTFGFSAQAAADETQKLIVLASDLAATFGGPVSDAVNAISSLLRGEVNPIERYGVAMNEALVSAKALELGLAGTTAELDSQDKTLARLAILMEQTANAQGQFGRESETTAGRLERIRAQFENTRAEIGEALIPAFQQLLDLTPALIQVFEDGLVPALASLSAGFANVDASGFVQNIATIPAAINNVFGGLGDVAGSLFDVFQAVGEGLVGDIGGGIDEIASAVDRIERIGDRFTLSKAVQDLQASIAAGQAPIEAFFNVLADTADTLDADQLGALTFQLQAVAGLDFAGLGDLRRFLQTADDAELEALGFDSDEIEAVTEALTIMRREILGVGDDAVESGRKGRGFGGDLDVIAASAALAAPEINDFATSIDFLNQRAAQGVDFTALREAFESLPNELDAAQAALRDEEGEIVEDFGTFLGNLREELERRRLFADNIEALRALGLDSLAEVFTDAGLDAAAALADAVANPEEAARAEAELDAFAREQAQTFAIAFGQEVKAFVDAFNPIEMPVVPVLDTSGFRPRIPADVLSGEAPTENLGINITQNFTSPETPETDRARAIQSINGVVAGNLN